MTSNYESHQLLQIHVTCVGHRSRKQASTECLPLSPNLSFRSSGTISMQAEPVGPCLWQAGQVQSIYIESSLFYQRVAFQGGGLRLVSKQSNAIALALGKDFSKGVAYIQPRDTFLFYHRGHINLYCTKIPLLLMLIPIIAKCA